MTANEFTRRWLELNYNRVRYQGNEVVFPGGNRVSNRKAFGRSGKGRHSLFCFADSYLVETWRDGKAAVFEVRRTTDDKSRPYQLNAVSEDAKDGHGTRISAEILYRLLPVSEVRDLICTKFSADPSVRILVNNEEVVLTDLEHHLQTETVGLPWGTIDIDLIDSEQTGRTSKQHGVAWWVNRRLVGDLSWKRLSASSPFLDARTVEGKRFTFIVRADALASDVKFDWSGFEASHRARETVQGVEDHITNWLARLTAHSRKDRKVAALQTQRTKLQALPSTSRDYIGGFLEEVQRAIPTIGQDTLNDATAVLCTLEEARSGRQLLQLLASLAPDEMDNLYDLLSQWSIWEAKLVLDELKKRLDIISELERLVENPSADELHQLQPLFEQGLWIFGPEYESVAYTSNKSLTTVIRKFLPPSGEGALPVYARKRPDFVALPERSIGVYSCDGYDPDTGEVNGIEKVLIVELKRGGFEVTKQEVRQAQDYAEAIRESGKVSHTGKIVGYVLGATIGSGVTRNKAGDNDEIIICPRPYCAVLQAAHARTFHLLEKIRNARTDLTYDEDVATVLSEPEQMVLGLESA